MIDEGPSSEDIQRFSEGAAYCPDCGAEVFDDADVCPKCYAYLGGDTNRHPPMQRWFQQRWVIAVVVLILIGLLLGTFGGLIRL